jgi:N-acetylglucosamine-6-phosphate deacetylase
MPALTTPLFWDLHLHGVAGIDFMHAELDELVFACEELGRNGTGYFAPTLLTAPRALLREACSRWGGMLESVSRKSFLPAHAARPIGLHLEGPFLNPVMAGAHPREDLIRPSLALMREFFDAARGRVAIVTLAPELPGAIAAIRWLARKGVRVQLGHSTATVAQALEAARAGATGVTHLYNAMRVHHRAPGLVGALNRGQLTSEIITDGVHLDAAFVGWCVRAARGRIYAVSDGCAAIGIKRGARAKLGELNLERQGDVAVVAESGVLAGGATFLATHPYRLARGSCGLEPGEILELFHRLGSSLCGGTRPPRAPTRNYFDGASLKYLGTE